MDYSWTWQHLKGNIVSSKSFTVSAMNTSGRYEEYCRYIEETARQIGRPPDETELLLMSVGGRSKQSWREYVIENRSPPTSEIEIRA
jgi:hypothetical protein